MSTLPLRLAAIDWSLLNENFGRTETSVNELYELLRKAMAALHDLEAGFASLSKGSQPSCGCEGRLDALERGLYENNQRLSTVDSRLSEVEKALLALQRSTQMALEQQEKVFDQKLADLESRLSKKFGSGGGGGKCECADALQRLSFDVNNRLAILEKAFGTLDAQVREGFDHVNGTCHALKAALDRLTKRVEVLEAGQKDAVHRLDSAEGSLGSLFATAAAIRGDLDGLSTTVVQHHRDHAKELALLRAQLGELPPLLASLEVRERDDVQTLHDRIDALAAELARALKRIAAMVTSSKPSAADEPLMRKSACLSCDFTTATVASDRRPAGDILKAPAGMAPAAVLRLRANTVAQQQQQQHAFMTAGGARPSSALHAASVPSLVGRSAPISHTPRKDGHQGSIPHVSDPPLRPESGLAPFAAQTPTAPIVSAADAE